MNRNELNAVFQLLKIAAEQGYVDAQYNLGVCYYNGDGVRQDDKEAYYWYLISFRNGFTDAEQNVKRIENKLTDQQKQEVKKRVNEWFRNHLKE